VIVLVAAVAVLFLAELAPVKAMVGGAVLGVLRGRLAELSLVKPVLGFGSWAR
jgi:hypothetical protein